MPRFPAWPSPPVPVPLLLIVALFVALPAGAEDPPPPVEASKRLEQMSLDELMSLEIVSASRRAEKLSEAPATVLVLEREEILARGYTDLSELLLDLPGMDVVRPWGPTYFKNYWRGYRNTIGDPYLVMVDGVAFNHLYFNTGDVMVAFPLSNVERVEVVYGPASSVYGANASMGVVNVITTAPPEGSSFRGTLTAGSAGARIADVTASWRQGQLSFSATTRLEEGRLEPGDPEAYEYTSPRHYGDRRLWGGFVDNPRIAGEFLSPHRTRALDLRLGLGTTELVLQHYRLEAGNGVEYVGDRAQNNAVWARPETSVHLRSRHELGKGLDSTTLVRWRRSDVSNDSFFLESLPAESPGGEQTAVFSYWQSLNSSWAVVQDLQLERGERLVLSGGFRYERKDLQKAYDILYGPALPVDEIDASSYPYPEPAPGTPRAPNRILTEDRGAYLQARWRMRPDHLLNLGLRHDDNSQYGCSTTVRAGYVGRLGRWGLRALYGEAFQEPVPRLLYGGWTGSGSDPALQPELSSTVELSGSFTTGEVGALLSLYRVDDERTIVNTPEGARNLGDRDVVGLDAHLRVLLPKGRLDRLEAWAYGTRLLQADERTDGATHGIGDLARTQLHAGLLAARGHWTASLRGRWFAARDTVLTNPVPRVPAFGTVDLALAWDDLVVPGLGLSLKVTNALDEAYVYPGVRNAEAGDTPGRFDEDGVWRGSLGYFSSLLPQPGRALLVSLRLRR